MTAAAEPRARTVRQVRSWLRERGRQRDPRAVLRRLLDIYDTLIGLGIVGGMLAETVIHAAAHQGPFLGGPASVAEWTVLVAAALLVVAAANGLRTIGPVLVGRGAYTWLVSSPVDRGGVLRRRYLGVLGITAGGGAAIGALLTVARSTGLPSPVWIVATGLLAGVIVTAWAVLSQAAHAGSRRLGNYLIVALVALAGMGTAGTRWGWTPPVLVVPPWALVVPGSALAVLLGGWAGAVLGRLDRHAVTAGNEIATAAVVAGAWLDPSLLTAILETRRGRRIGRVRSRRIAGGRVGALLRAELLRVRRRPSAVLVWCGLLLIPYLAGLMFSGVVVAPVQLFGTFLAADRFAGGLRVVCRSSALRFTLGGTDADLRLTHLLLPALAALVWSALAAPALHGHVLATTVLSAVGATIAIYRVATRPPMDYSSPALATPFGVVPINLVRQLARGPALLLILGIAQIFLAGS
ncbi:MAG TPA: DUF6297 family protein [Pseudonocardiaceae bacterium]|jgi:hypothetical protein|nr:DUF6297 family protein [Pseudonocardiaceae bacterium]